MLREVLEASEACRAGSLHDAAVERLGQSVFRRVGHDPGVTVTEKRAISDAVKRAPRYDGLAYHTIAQLAERITGNYLRRWAAILGGAGQPPELTARSIATHLLDHGFSTQFLHAWFSQKLYRDPTPISLAELCEAAHGDLAVRAPANFEVLVAFQNAPRSASGYPTNWLNTAAVVQWLRQNDFAVNEVRATGGLLLTIESRDAQAAADLAADRIDQFVARSSVATTSALKPWPAVWVRGQSRPFPFGPRPRGVRVKALYREDQIFNDSATNVDAAIELIAHLENSSASAAVAGGWAAIEALLAEPGDRANAAESLASIVACSFPRAELTALSYACEPECVDLAPALQACTENRQRAQTIAGAILQGHTLNLRRPSDRASHRRMLHLLESPSKRLTALQVHLADAFHRLYRQRNIILHGAKTNSIALRGSLRTSAKLVGAGMDRIVHAWYVKETRPVELAARARSAILLVPEGSPAAFVDLLGV